MNKIFNYLLLILLLLLRSNVLPAQKHLANGEEVLRGNRLISVKSEVGKKLYQPSRMFLPKHINMDGKMNEPEWDQAMVIAPFINTGGNTDQTSVKVLYDQENIYLFCSIDQPDGITSNMKDKDSIITNDDYIQIDLKPWLPDNITKGRDYYYSIAVNPDGMIWDSYMDPYLGGFFFSSWNSEAKVFAVKKTGHWDVEITIPYSGLDVSSDPGRKWNIEFHHGTFKEGKTDISSPNIGITVQQDVMVRNPALVAYYWTRPEFMQEVKPDLSKQKEKNIFIAGLKSLPAVDQHEDNNAWSGIKALPIEYADRTGKLITANKASAKVAMSGDILSFNLNAEGSKIKSGVDTANKLGSGMAAQMAGVNGVFVDASLFQNESFWIVLQPRSNNADKIHQDYYLILVNNRGEIKGTHYDAYGTPFRSWIPKADIDIYNTSEGWGAEVNLDLSSFDIPVGYSRSWGMNIFHNSLMEGKPAELQAWKYTGNDFFNPEKFGELSGINLNGLNIFRSNISGKIKQTDSLLSTHKDQNLIGDLRSQLRSLNTASQQQLKIAESTLQHISQVMGTIDAMVHYNSVPHVRNKDYPLMDVQFIGEDGWAVGAMGTLLITKNGGKKWEKISLNSDADLYRVKFVNKNEGWVAGGRIRIAETNEGMRHDQRGGFAYIYHTKDGGKTWQCQFAEQGRHLFALDFVNTNTGYAAGERGFLMKTMDGGQHWNILPTTGTINWLYGITFRDENNGFAVGLNETVIRTTDGGHTWKKINAPADKKFYGFRPIYRDISFNGNTGCIVGQNGSVLISQNGGDTWEPAATLYQNDTRELMDLRSVKFVTPQRGYAVGELGSKIMTTEDGGRNWTYRNTGNTEWLRAVWANASGKLFVVGEREKVLFSPDHGLTWVQLKGEDTKTDVMLLMAHGDDAALHFNSFMAHYAVNENKKIVNVAILSGQHSSEYEETYDIELDRNTWMMGVGTVTNFNQFETGNNGANYQHYNQRLWEGEENIVRRMVAAIRAYKPDIIITHDGVFGDYDKPDHKISGRAGLTAFESAGGDIDQWPEITRLGLKPWQPKKLYNLAGDRYPPQSYPATIDITSIGNQPLKGTNMSNKEFGNYVIRNYQSQGVYLHLGTTKLSLIRSNVKVPEKESSVFDGLKK